LLPLATPSCASVVTAPSVLVFTSDSSAFFVFLLLGLVGVFVFSAPRFFFFFFFLVGDGERGSFEVSEGG
jgi:hypothetical protein